MKNFVFAFFLLAMYGSATAQNPLVRELVYDNAGNRVQRRMGATILEETHNLQNHTPEHPSVLSSVYPNPAQHTVTVSLAVPVAHASVILVDASGRTLLSQKIEDTHLTQLDVSNLPNGQYWIWIRGQDFQAHWALTKQE